MQFNLAYTSQINRQLQRTSEEEFWLKGKALVSTMGLDFGSSIYQTLGNSINHSMPQFLHLGKRG